MMPFFGSNANKEDDKLEVRIYGDPVLRQKAEPIKDVTPEVRKLAQRMCVTMLDEESRGIGLAGPQVGVGLRIITLDTCDDNDVLPPDASPGECLLHPRMPLTLLNPEIVWQSPQTVPYTEGCLSIPELFGDVTRPISIVLRAQTLDGEAINVECGGLLARCVQHELDHLDGVLFVDRLTEEDRTELEPQLKKLEKLALKRLRKRKTQA